MTKKIATLIFSVSLLIPGFTMEPEKNDDLLSQSGQALIDYLTKATKLYQSGENLPCVPGEDPIPLYTQFAETLTKIKPEDSLPIWGKLAGSFINISELPFKNDLQKKEFTYLKTEWEQFTKEDKTDKIWFDLFMLRLSIVNTDPKKRDDIEFASSKFDLYLIELMNHQIEGEPAWWTHDGFMAACEKIGSEYTRNILSPSKIQKSGIWTLPCPFSLSMKQMIEAYPLPECPLWLAGFNLDVEDGDGGKDLNPCFYYMHDLQHLGITVWFSSLRDMGFFYKDGEKMASPEELWSLLKEEKKLWIEVVKKFKEMARNIDSQNMTDQEMMNIFYAFSILHEQQSSLLQRLEMIFSRWKFENLFREGRNFETLRDPAFYLYYLPLSLQKKALSVFSFRWAATNYLYKFYDFFDNSAKDMRENFLKFRQNYLNLIKTNKFESLLISESLYSIDNNRIYTEMPHEGEKIQLHMLQKYGCDRGLFKVLQKKKKDTPSVRLVRYHTDVPLFYAEETLPLMNIEYSNMDKESENEGFPMLMLKRANGLYHQNKEEEAILLCELAIKQGYTPAIKVIEIIQQNRQKLSLLEKGANENNVEAMVDFARRLQTGWHIKADYPKAISYYEKVIELEENGEALCNLAMMYNYGSGTEVNIQKAIDLNMRAIEKGCYAGMSNLAMIYYNGRDIEKDFEKAKEWLKKSVEHKNSTAMCNLAGAYSMEEESQEKCEQISLLLKKAAHMGEEEALEMAKALVHKFANEWAKELYKDVRSLYKHSQKEDN